MRLIAILFLALPTLAHAWGAAGLAYMNPHPPQQNPQASYSEQYNAGYMDGYLNAHGYDANGGQGTAYRDGYHAAEKAENRR